MRPFDPLKLLIKGNEELKEAYDAGVAFGREKEREVTTVELKDLLAHMEKTGDRALELDLGNTKGLGLSETGRTSFKKQVATWYRDGHLNAAKILRGFLKTY